MKRVFIIFVSIIVALAVQARTLVVYYSYTNNVNTIVSELCKEIDADIVRIEPAEKGLDYTANNYALGSALISAIRNNPKDESSYPKIDPVDVNPSDYDCIIVGAPLWWGNMAAPLQTYLFHNGSAMAGKKIGLIVSSASGEIYGVENDAKRLIPDGIFLTPSLWIRSSQMADAPSLILQWLKAIKYDKLTGSDSIASDKVPDNAPVFTIGGIFLGTSQFTFQHPERGIYIINGKKRYVNH